MYNYDKKITSGLLISIILHYCETYLKRIYATNTGYLQYWNFVQREIFAYSYFKTDWSIDLKLILPTKTWNILL